MPALAPTALLQRLRRDFERDVRRNVRRTRNGLRHLAGVGRPELGSSPADVVWKRHKVRLLRYRSDQRRLGPPVLLVMSLVTKPTVLDLRPGNSFVEALLRRGFDVYLVDWGVPDAAEARNSFETYIDDYLPFAAAAAMRTSGADSLHLFGYCFGGVLSLLFAGAHPEIPLRSLTLLATPVDFQAIGGLNNLLADRRVDPEVFLDETGNVPARSMLRGLSAARVTGDVSTYASLIENLEHAEYLDAHHAMHGWASDHIPFPGACFRQTTDWLIRDNRLAHNDIVTARGRIDLRSISCDVLNIVGTADHLIPMASNAPVRNLLPQTEELVQTAGHVGLIVGGKAHRTTVPAIADWLEARSEPV